MLPGHVLGRSVSSTDGGEGVCLLFVDDDEGFREAAAGELADLGFTVKTYRDGPSLLAALQDGTAADAIVLDWALSGIGGIDILKRIRREGTLAPVVFLTRHPSVVCEKMALEQGALDFVAKARGMPILAKRLRRIVGATKLPETPERSEAFHCGRLLLVPRDSIARWDDVDVQLTQMEFKIVRFLASRVGEYVTYRAIYECMHHAGFVARSGEAGYGVNVRSAIKRIRSKFQLIDPAFDHIENYPSFGYRWEASTQEVATSPAETPASARRDLQE
jgi:two-component system, OmpR family, response regulator ChvI